MEEEAPRPNPIVPVIDEGMTPSRHRHRGPRDSILRRGYNAKNGTWAPDSPVGRLLTDVRSGATPRGAARHLNIPPATLAQWIAKGRNLRIQAHGTERNLFSDFIDVLERCEGAYEVELSGVVRRGAHDNPRIALEVLAKRFADDGWGDAAVAAAPIQTINVTNIDLGALMSDPHVLRHAASVADRIAELERGGVEIIETTAVEADGQPA